MAWQLFKKKPKTNLGIDIGTSAIKIVELEKKQERHQLKTYGIFPLNEYLKHLGPKLRLEAARIEEKELAEMIKRIFQEADVQNKKVRFSIPVYSSFSIAIDLPPMPKEEIAAAIPFEAKRYIPVPLSDVILDWSIISSPPKLIQKNQKENKVKAESIQALLVAVPKETISRYTQIAQLANLQIQALEAETFSLARSLVGRDQTAILLVDTGARSTNISIIDGGYVRLTHNLEIGGAELSRGLAQRMNISIERAEEIKKISQQRRADVEAIINSIFDLIIAEIRKIIIRYQNQYQRRVEKCILAGSGVKVVNLPDYLSRQLNLEVSIGNPFSRVVYPDVLRPAIQELGPALAVAVGLAMRE